MKTGFSIIYLVSFCTINCNNLGLLEKLENPGGRLYAFVSSLTTVGNMSALSNGNCSGGGTTQADCACTNLARAAGLNKNSGSRFVAWLSDLNSDMTCRINGVSGSNCAGTGGSTWYNTNNEVIAINYADLFDSNLSAPIKYTELRSASSALNAWTGTNANGKCPTAPSACVVGDNCSNWGDGTTGNGVRGSIGDSGVNWSNNLSSSPCNIAHPVYCFAVP